MHDIVLLLLLLPLQWRSGPHEAAGHPACGDQCRQEFQRIGSRVQQRCGCSRPLPGALLPCSLKNTLHENICRTTLAPRQMGLGFRVKGLGFSMIGLTD